MGLDTAAKRAPAALSSKEHRSEHRHWDALQASLESTEPNDMLRTVERHRESPDSMFAHGNISEPMKRR
jgi:hypothetical protein